tara:strand:- start:138 stop:698 length:561 start_codon:yes stop_codon:yes gene_type:complete
MQKTTTTILANVTAATKTIEAKEKSLIKPLDELYADGMRSVDFKSPAKGLDRTDYNNLKAAVVAGFTVADRKLLVADTKSMDDATKALKKKTQQKIGSRMGDIARLLKAREPKVERATGGSTNQSATPAAPAANNTSATPLKSYIEKVSTGRDILKAIPPSQLTTAKLTKLEKLIGDLIEELKSIK